MYVACLSASMVPHSDLSACSFQNSSPVESIHSFPDGEPEAREPGEIVWDQELGVASGLGADTGWRMQGGDPVLGARSKAPAMGSLTRGAELRFHDYAFGG